MIRAVPLPITEAQARLLALAPPLSPETIPLAQATNHYATTPVQALRTQPYADLSAMDGYAIRYEDLPGPWTLIGESAAGRPFAGQVGPGQATRIFTGATMPAGADTVLVQEEARVEGTTVHLAGEGPRRKTGNVRPAGLDFTQGDTLIEAGQRLTPARIALAAIAGHGTLQVARKIRVALAATGDELVPPGSAATPEQLPESNRTLLATMLADMPVELIDLGILPDNLDTLTHAFQTVQADLIVTTGGASVGDHDLVRPALEAAGGEIDFWRIALRPGKPMMAGRLGDAIVLGLPGNPVSAFVTAFLFVKPLVAHLSGARDPFPAPLKAQLADPLPANGERTDYLRAALVDGKASAAAIQDSSMVRTLARADCLIVRPPHAPPTAVDETVDILLLG